MHRDTPAPLTRAANTSAPLTDAALAHAVQAVADALQPSAAARDREGGTAWQARQVLRDSGLLNLAVPTAFGGLGGTWPQVLRAVRCIAQADSSLAHLFGFQHLQVASVLLFGSAAQHQQWLGATVAQGWFWGNAVNGRDPRLTATPNAQGWVLDGVKAFCSGATGSDMLHLSFTDPAQPEVRHYAVVPTARTGITVNADWDNMGQRQTDSGTVHFAQVQVLHTEVLGPPGADARPRATLRQLIAQLILTEIYLGNAHGALHSAAQYTRTHVHPWPMAGVARAVDDPLLQLRAGELWAQLQAATLLADHAHTQLQHAWAQGEALSEATRAHAALQVTAARVNAARTALHVTAQTFELMGARATTAPLAMDRYWRNVRVHTLHDPVDWRCQALGHWLLTDTLPTPSPYG